MRAPLIAAAIACALLVTVGCGGDDPSMSPLGGPCDGPGDCEDGLSCVRAERYPGGYCSRGCADAPCPTGARCDEGSSPALCVNECASESDCRAGYQCWRGGCRPRCAAGTDCSSEGATCSDEGLCVGPECETAADCGPGLACVGGACVVGSDGGGVTPVGAACANHRECASGACLPSAAGGVCTTDCDSADDCFVFTNEAGCGALAWDDEGDGAPDRARTVCVLSPEPPGALGSLCASDAECGARLCLEGQCTEVCEEERHCVLGQRCVERHLPTLPASAFQACGYAPRLSPIQVDEVPLDTRELMAGGGTFATLALPPDAVSLTLQARRTSGDQLGTSFITVTDPNEVTLFDIAEIAELRDQPIRWLPFDPSDVAAMLIANTLPDRVRFVPGPHSFGVGTIPRSGGDTGRATLETSALVVRSGDGQVSSGTLALNIFLVGVGTTAATAPSDSRLQGAITRLGQILAPAAISLGEVRYFDVSGADAAALSIIETRTGEDSDLAALFRLSAGRAGRTLNVFLVRSIEGDEGFQSLGIAGGIPGPVGLHGTTRSGVVVAFDAAVVGSGSSGANRVGHIMAHEAGHYLGLFHTTERGTPCAPGEDPSGGCSIFGGADVLSDTTRGDTSNLMHWSIVGGGSNTALSAGQGQVMRWSALTSP